MKVGKLIEILKELNPDKEIRYDSYEISGDFEIKAIEEREYKGKVYYTISD